MPGWLFDVVIQSQVPGPSSPFLFALDGAGAFSLLLRPPSVDDADDESSALASSASFASAPCPRGETAERPAGGPVSASSVAVAEEG